MHSEAEEPSLRIFTNCPKEIKFTNFLLSKLCEKYGKSLLLKLQDSFDLYLKLNDCIMDFGLVVLEIDDI